MDKKSLIVAGVILFTMQIILNLGIFVTPVQMEAYAASKDSLEIVITHLNRIEAKLDKLMGF